MRGWGMGRCVWRGVCRGRMEKFFMPIRIFVIIRIVKAILFVV